MRDFTGPGRLVTGNSSLFEGFHAPTRLDEAVWSSATSLDHHDHRAFYFRLGRYSSRLCLPHSLTAPPSRRPSM